MTGQDGSAPALIFENGPQIGRADLFDAVRSARARLTGPKMLVAIEARRSPDAVIAYLAALEAGHAAAMLPPDDSAAWARFEAAYAPDMVARETDGAWTWAPGRPAQRAHAIHPQLAVLLSTSGSTGEAKCVRLSYANLRANAEAIAAYLELRPDDRAAHVLPLQYCYGLSVLQSHLIAGASLYFPSGSVRDPGFAESIGHAGCTNLAGVPHTFRLLEEAGFRDSAAPGLRFMAVAGGQLAPALVERYHRHQAQRSGRFFVMYGQTEATARIAFMPPESLDGRFDRIGVAIPGGEIALVDAAGREIAAAEEPGEIVYRGPNVMMGYAGTRADLAEGATRSELRTGDLGLRDAEGFYRIVGRLKRMSKISGLRVSHDALERVLSERGVEAAVVGDDSTLLAVHVSDLADDRVRSCLAEATGLPRLAIRAERVRDLPRLSTGKVDYAALKRRLAAPGEGSESRTSGPSVQALFEETFAPMAVRSEDSFVSLGGDSLRFVQLSIALERRLGALPDGWETQSIRALSRRHAAQDARPPLRTEFLVRAAAILLVVIHHATLWPIPGGAAALMALVGYSLARFHGAALAEGDVGRLWRVLPLVLGPYYAVLIGYALAWGEIPWASVFLIGNAGFADPVDHDMLPYLYWFVEIYVQTLLIVAAVFLWPAARRLSARRPFAFALAFLGGALVLRFGLAENWSFGGRQIFTIPWNLYVAAFGWAAAVAVRVDEKLLLLAIGAAVFPAAAYLGGDWTGSWVKYMIVLGVIAILVAAPSVRLPRAAALTALALSAAGYHIYLLHRILPEAYPALFGEGEGEAGRVAVSVLVGIATGFLGYALQKVVLRQLGRWRSQPRHADA